MSFLNPAFLYGLTALAIPVIIHLFHFRKARKVYFSSTRFLQSVKKVSQAKLKLKHFLVLVARMLFVVFLVLTFAQPFIPATTGADNAELVDIYIDNSYSMSNKVDEDLSGLDAAVQLASEVAAAYPENTRFRLLTNNFEAASQFYVSQEIINDRLTETNFSATSRSMGEVLERMKILPNEMQNQKRDVFLLSDFQQNMFARENIETYVDTLEQLYLLPVEYAQNKNVYVDTVYLEKPVIFSSSQNTVYVVLANTGQQPVSEMPVSLTVNGMRVANSSIDIPARGQETIRFQLNFELLAYNRCEISFEEYPVTFDNEFYFVIRKAAKVQVLEITEEKKKSAISRVYADTSYFRHQAYESANLDYGALPEADLVVVNGLASLDENLKSALLNYQQAGGALLLIPSENGMPEATALLASNLNFKSAAIQEPVRLAPIPSASPFFENVFEDQQVTFDMPRARAVSSWSGNAEGILELQTGNPFLSRAGNTYLLASPLEEDFTGFHQHALFVPVMYKIAFNSLELTNKLYQTTDENYINLQADDLQQQVVYKLRQDGQEVIPNQRISGRSLFMEIPAYTLNAGFYELVAEGEVMYQLAFNHSQKESQISQIETAELQEIAAGNNNMQLIEGIDVRSARAGMQEKFKGQALWKWTLLLALLSLLAEVLLIRFLK